MDAKLKNRIIGALRKLSYSYKPRTQALNKRKVGPATFQCQQCSTVVYKGDKETIDDELTERFPHVRIGRIVMDHIEPVIDPSIGWESWDKYIQRMFCDIDGWQALCDDCHNVKTKQELEVRKKYRKLNKEKESANIRKKKK